jgi:drug/metabolite transporter (DMT)-like permease
VVGIFWFPKRKKHTPFQWKWSIPCIGILLIIADFSYFSAIQEEEALISIISPIRRSNAFFALIIGGLFFKEMNKRKKVYAMTGVFIGILLIALA